MTTPSHFTPFTTAQLQPMLATKLSSNSSLATPGIQDSTSIPLSFPSILRNPGLTDRFAHLRLAPNDKTHSPSAQKTSLKHRKRDDNEGKRWIRRKENAKFSGNPHITPASKKDYTPHPPSVRRTFPEPLPAYLSRNTTVPAARIPAPNPISANAGRFSMSLKGMRKDLRKMGGKTESLVRDVEAEIALWLEVGVLLNPGTVEGEPRFPGVGVRGRDNLREVGRSVLQLVWVTDDPLTRYVVHCCARYHDIVSFSKEVNSQRVTYLLRPNVTRPDRQAQSTLDTPPGTDLDYPSHEHESDIISEPPSSPDIDSDILAEHDSDMDGALSAIEESPAPRTQELDPDKSWSVVGDTDAEGDESESEHGLVASVGSLSIQDVNASPRVVATPAIRHHSSLRPRVWEYRHGRSTSSPSRSPSRRITQRRNRRRIEPPVIQRTHPKSFYDYLYA